DAGGGLAVDVANGRLTATNADTVGLSTLRLASTGELVVTLDPAATRNTRFNVAGAATLESGAKIGVRLASKLTAPASFTLIDAGAGQLTAGTLDQGLLAATPWLYKAELRIDQSAGDLLADVRRRTAAEAGLDAAESAAYDAVFLNFDRDATLAGAMLAKTDEASFRRLYDQLLPDYSGGLFHTLAQATEAAGRGIDSEPTLMGRDGLRAWTQEIGFVIKRDLERSGSYDATGFGIAAGVEAPDTVMGVLGVQASFLTLDVDEKNSGANEFLGGSVFSAGLYWREKLGGLTASLGATGGYASLDSRRTVVDVDAGLNRETKSDWSGGLFTLHGGLSYQADLGPVFLRPQASVDYLWFKEGDRTESGGGEAIDLDIDGRTSSQLAAFVGATLGMRLGFGGEMEWSPELTGGWRQVSGKGPGDTTARFLGGGETFTLSSPDLDGGAAVARAAFRGSGTYFDIGVEGGAEFRDEYDAYDARLYARVKF
ncbi:MAG TPA: autotransporter outer membrane beta-barrel domain-containing protein, partial [Phenylobacterium sp.]|nr:autotransporter outer membrane beta-barrel domain-containing protein [Phenylobacterium sp.]